MRLNAFFMLRFAWICNKVALSKLQPLTNFNVVVDDDIVVVVVVVVLTVML